MRVRTVFNIVIRLFGLFVILKSGISALSIFSGHLRTFPELELTGNDVVFILFTFLVPIAMGVIGLVVIGMSDKIIDAFQLEKGIEEDTLILQYKPQQLIEVALIIAGTIYIVDLLGAFAQDFIAFLQYREDGDKTGMKNIVWLLVSAIVQLGATVLIIYKSPVISKWISPKKEVVMSEETDISSNILTTKYELKENTPDTLPADSASGTHTQNENSTDDIQPS